jgi:hypothetical protein
MGKLEHYDIAVFDRLLCEVLVKAGDFNSQDITNSLLALVSVQHYNEKAISVLLKELSRQPASLLGTEALSQCYQVLLALSLEQPSWDLQHLSWKSLCEEAWALGVASSRSSKLHKAVSKVLGNMGVTHTNKSVEGTLSVDIVILDSPTCKRLVVEVDGPSHFCRNQLQRELGPTLLKRRLLAKQGWVCVC